MPEDTDEAAHGEDDADAGEREYPAPPERSTAPQSEYTMGDVTTGAVIALVGVVVTFGLPLLL